MKHELSLIRRDRHIGGGGRIWLLYQLAYRRILIYCKSGNFRIGGNFRVFVFFANNYPNAKIKPLNLYEGNRSRIMKITQTWNVLPTFLWNFLPAKITMFYSNLDMYNHLFLPTSSLVIMLSVHPAIPRAKQSNPVYEMTSGMNFIYPICPIPSWSRSWKTRTNAKVIVRNSVTLCSEVMLSNFWYLFLREGDSGLSCNI